jgi:hypothetical protein
MTEQWQSVPGYEGYYEVSDHGRVRSLSRTMQRSDGTSRRFAGKIFNPHVGNPPYPQVTLSKEGIRWNTRMHVVVMLTFVGPCPEGMEIRHLNGISTDCRLDNLAYGTPTQNMTDNVTHGKHHNAIKTHCLHGHEFTPENTIAPVKGKSWRGCRACMNERTKAYKARKRREAKVS